MRQTTLPIPEIGAIAATRGLAGAGIGFLLADRIPKEKRTKLGWLFVGIGVLTTVPFLMDVIRRSKEKQADI